MDDTLDDQRKLFYAMIYQENNSTIIKIVLIEDHDDFRNSLSFLLNSNDQFACTSYSKAEDALENLNEDNPDVIIMDINLPGMSGIDCTSKIKEKHSSIQILMCTVYEDDEKIFDALKAGATGYLLKRAGIDEIFSSLFEILKGGSPMTPTIARKVVASFFPKVINLNKLENLSERENEILNLLSDGLRLKEISDRLCISINTVRSHIRHIYEKLQVNSRVDALNKVGKNHFRQQL